MLEVLVSALVIPLARKLGDRWIDRVAGGTDDVLVDLLKRVGRDDAQQDEFLAYLESHTPVAEQLTANVINSVSGDALLAAAESTLLPVGIRIAYYQTFLDWLVEKTMRAERNALVLHGFLTGESYASLLLRNPGFTRPEHESSFSRIGNAMTPRFGWTIRIAPFGSTEERDSSVESLRAEIRSDDYGRLQFDIYEKFDEVKEIREHIVRFKRGIPDADIPDDYEGIEAMRNSFHEFAQLDANDLDALRLALGATI